MSQDMKPTRPWQEIAAEASQEQDSKKLRALVAELEAALEERDKVLRPMIVPAQRTNPADGQR